MVAGEQFIGRQAERGDGAPFHAIAAATGKPVEPEFRSAGMAQLDRACALAAAAAPAFAALDLSRRAAFLDAIADAIADTGDALIERAMLETGLPKARLEGERGRTVGQLRLFAQVVRSGDFEGRRIDPALPDRQPLPRPDIRLRKVPLGPVAVFGASNFPLAFSVAGGDTASALAAGCPVVAKAHPAHPGTSEIVARAVRDAVAACGLPEGIFSLVHDAGHEIGQALVVDPRIAAVGFTGSRRGGLALLRLAQDRPVPIPVYAEMSSINPVILLPHALADRAGEIGRAFAASLGLGAGQFCTNPGLVLAIDGPALDAFAAAASDAISAMPASTMLTPGIAAAYRDATTELAAHPGVATAARGQPGEPTQCQAALFVTTAANFLADPRLQDEVFGAASLIVRCPDAAAIATVIDRLEGQLTAAIHAAEPDHTVAAALIPHLERKVGRILFNGFGTGVEVTHAMVHGGPYPATSDSRTTSVGSLAIDRFLRPVAYQDFPAALLPDGLRT